MSPSSARRHIAALVLALPLRTAFAAAPPPDQIVMSDTQVRQAGIALAALGAVAPGGTGEQTLAGTVVPAADAVSIASPAVPGVVQRIHVEAFEPLPAGAPLATLFSPAWMEMQRDYVQAATQSRLAAEKLARDEALYADGIVSRTRLDETRAAAALAALAMQQRAQALRAGGMGAAGIAALGRGVGLSAQLVVRAPAAGVVLEIPVALGQQVEAGMAVARLVRDGALRVELQATEAQQRLFAVGDLLQVPGCVQLKVEAVGPTLQSANQTVRIRARPLSADPCLKVNAYVEARVLAPRVPAAARLIPAEAVTRRGSGHYVFVRTPQGFRAVPVTSGAAGGGQAWIQGTLPADARVAVRGLAAIKGAWIGLGASAANAGGDR